MTVQELIDKLNGIEDKDVDVFLDSGDINLWNACEDKNLNKERDKK